MVDQVVFFITTHSGSQIDNLYPYLYAEKSRGQLELANLMIKDNKIFSFGIIQHFTTSLPFWIKTTPIAVPLSSQST